MPSGRTHDQITLWCLPMVAGFTYNQTHSGDLTLLVSGSFLLGGLMFGPDLDIYSRQYQRWGWLRWIWLPYQKSLHHRSFLSHGPLIGTALRLLYFASWVAMFAALVLIAGKVGWGWQWRWAVITEAIAQFLRQYSTELLAVYIGLELGAMSHSLSDWTGSTYKRLKKQGIAGLLFPGKGKNQRGERSDRRRGERSDRTRKKIIRR